VVKIGGAGACHSDLHLMHDFEAGMMPWRMPFTLGHENAGWVDSVGDGVSTFAEGDAVARVRSLGCGKCDRCPFGAESYCENQAAAPVVNGGGGLGLDGGMAEYLLVPFERLPVPLSKTLEPTTAAPLSDDRAAQAIKDPPAATAPTCCWTLSELDQCWNSPAPPPGPSVTSRSSASPAARCRCRCSRSPTRSASRRRIGIAARARGTSRPGGPGLIHVESTAYLLDDAPQA
jgi:Alcohol dehydrogenase GroES-like domain